MLEATDALVGLRSARRSGFRPCGLRPRGCRYTAVLLAFFGFGLTRENGLSPAAAVVLPTASLRRIASTEPAAY